jgi:BMFP domain-containing protein YqiC
MQAMTERSQAGTPPTDFNQFYNEWSAINEQEFTALFNTEEYAALQGELIKLNSELNKAYERQMEVLLQPYPVVLRSQLDEVYKVNHELRSRLNDLERLVNELQNARSESNGQAAAQAPAAPASDASQGGQPNQSNDPGKAVRKDKS